MTLNLLGFALAFELAVPCEVFGIDRSGMGMPNYRLLLCRTEDGPLRANVGYSVEVPYDLSTLVAADTVIVPAWRDIAEPPPEPFLEALQRAYRRGARIVSLCSGAFVAPASRRPRSLDKFQMVSLRHRPARKPNAQTCL